MLTSLSIYHCTGWEPARDRDINWSKLALRTSYGSDFIVSYMSSSIPGALRVLTKVAANMHLFSSVLRSSSEYSGVGMLAEICEETKSSRVRLVLASSSVEICA